MVYNIPQTIKRQSHISLEINYTFKFITDIILFDLVQTVNVYFQAVYRYTIVYFVH